MKTMTCRQLGGPCDLAHRGETADDVIKAQDRHLKDAEKAGDAVHQPARHRACWISASQTNYICWADLRDYRCLTNGWKRNGPSHETFD